MTEISMRPLRTRVRRLWPTLAVSCLGLLATPALAQSNPGYFIPPSGQQQSQTRRPPTTRPRPVQPSPAMQPMGPPQGGPGAGDVGPGPIAGPGAEEPQGPPMQLQLPPAPQLPQMAKGTQPPAAVIGVLGIPEIMRASTAAQQVEKIIGERREKLNEDAQKEQLVWREMQQSLANDRGKLTQDQVLSRQKDLQDRITSAQKRFRDRNRIIQEAGQYGLAQIERMLVSVIREVADSRGMNLVLHRSQVALNVSQFDITDQVVEQLNIVQPSVSLPDDGVEPPMAAVTPPPANGQASPASASPDDKAHATPAVGQPDKK